ncbi:cysteine sulfinic acid decarboxylase-like [Polymixia lowei]
MASTVTENNDQTTTNDNEANESPTDHSDGQMFLTEVFKVIMEEVLCKGTAVKEKVCEWQEPEQLTALLDLELREMGEPPHRLLQRIQDVIKYSVKIDHPRYFQLFSGVDYHSMAGRFLTEALNTGQYTYAAAPVFVLMENEVLRGLRLVVGWTEGDGIFCPGGSFANMYAMNLARYQAFPEVKHQGLYGLPQLAVFASQGSHHSVKKAASVLGIGMDNIILVKEDDRGRMMPEELDEKIQLAKSQGTVPFLVICTSATSALGAFDPLDQIADVCEKHKLWMHVDAAWGGGVLFSEQHRYLMKGVERVNSLSWNPHKMMLAGLQCSVFLLKNNKSLMAQCHSDVDTYLFQQDGFYDINQSVYDKTMHGRKVDCLKFWLMWKALGSNGFEQRVDMAFTKSRYLVQQVKKREGFKLVGEPEYVHVCFWFIPPSLRGKEGRTDYKDRLAEVAPAIKKRMMKQGTTLVGLQSLGDRVNFFRAVVLSPQVSLRDLDFFLDEIERLGNDL